MKTNKKNIISDIWVFYGSDNESKLESQRFQISKRTLESTKDWGIIFLEIRRWGMFAKMLYSEAFKGERE